MKNKNFVLPNLSRINHLRLKILLKLQFKQKILKFLLIKKGSIKITLVNCSQKKVRSFLLSRSKIFSVKF